MEIDERFYELIASLMINSGPTEAILEYVHFISPLNFGAERVDSPPQSHRTFIYSDPAQTSNSISIPPDTDGERHITLLEEQTVLQGGTTGLRTW